LCITRMSLQHTPNRLRQRIHCHKLQEIRLQRRCSFFAKRWSTQHIQRYHVHLLSPRPCH
jgi:hypothetical protein